ncbi:MAG: carboxypeptidase-like regulatory domain-containing protein [Flavobacterium sp.]|nr:carboxypeptidase-like regulatory domain-containing protein [Flavobacterium sp.]
MFLFFSFYSFSQEIQVLDFDTKKPISYALVYFYSDTKHFDTKYTDENGVLSISNNKTYTSLIIECLGYVTASLICKEVKDKIFLKTSLIKLEEVVVTNLKTTILGNNSSKIIENFPLLSVNQELSFYVENTLNKEYFIKNFKFYCSKKTDKLKYVLRFRMYKS